MLRGIVHGKRAVRELGTQRAEVDDVSERAASERLAYRISNTAILLHHVVRPHVRRDEEVESLRTVDRTRHSLGIVERGDCNLRSSRLPWRALLLRAHHDANR